MQQAFLAMQIKHEPRQTYVIGAFPRGLNAIPNVYEMVDWRRLRLNLDNRREGAALRWGRYHRQGGYATVLARATPKEKAAARPQRAA